jgi:RluA family pseudouridine synthase
VADTPPTRCPLLLDDGLLLAVAKPDGVLSHPNPGGARAACAFEGRYDPAARRFDTPAGPVWLVHRLDQDTSGVLLAARSEAAAAACRALFEQRKVRKAYLALVQGLPRPPQGRWLDRLAKQAGKGSVRSAVGRGGAPNAELSYRVQRNFREARCCLLQVTLVTGRTHQVRVQAASRKHPVAGDRVYGNFAWNRELKQRAGLRRLFLHALRLEFPHPSGGATVSLESPLPAELRSALDALA